MVSNTGTYLDTPFHRFADGHDLAGLDLARVLGVAGVLVDATTAQEATLPDGVEVTGRAVLFRTGWDRHWGTAAYGDPSHPFVGMGAIERLVADGAAVVGIDSVNIDDTRTGERPVHTTLLGAGIPIVEHLRGSTASPAARSRSPPSRRPSSAWGRSPSAPWPSSTRDPRSHPSVSLHRSVRAGRPRTKHSDAVSRRRSRAGRGSGGASATG